FRVLRFFHSLFQQLHTFQLDQNAVELPGHIPDSLGEHCGRFRPSHDVDVGPFTVVTKSPEILALRISDEARYTCPQFHNNSILVAKIISKVNPVRATDGTYIAPGGARLFCAWNPG